MKQKILVYLISFFPIVANAGVDPCDLTFNRISQRELQNCFNSISTTIQVSRRIVMEGHPDNQCPEAEVTTCKEFTHSQITLHICHLMQYRNSACWDDIDVAPVYTRNEYLVQN